MKKEEIRELLKKYYDGVSTDQEEVLLKEFFSREIVPEEFIHEREIFSYFRHSASIPEPSEGFEERIISAIGTADGENQEERKGIRRILYIAISIAAGFTILLGTYFLLSRSREPRDTYSDPAIAYAETMKILYNVSYQLNQGTRSLEPVSKLRTITTRSLEAVAKPARIMTEKFRSLDQLDRTVKALNLINNEKEINKN